MAFFQAKSESALTFSGISALVYLKFHIPPYELLIFVFFLYFQLQKVFSHKYVCYCGIFFLYEIRLPAAYEIQAKSCCLYFFLFFLCLFAYALKNIIHITLVYFNKQKSRFSFSSLVCLFSHQSLPNTNNLLLLFSEILFQMNMIYVLQWVH